MALDSSAIDLSDEVCPSSEVPGGICEIDVSQDDCSNVAEGGQQQYYSLFSSPADRRAQAQRAKAAQIAKRKRDEADVERLGNKVVPTGSHLDRPRAVKSSQKARTAAAEARSKKQGVVIVNGQRAPRGSNSSDPKHITASEKAGHEDFKGHGLAAHDNRLFCTTCGNTRLSMKHSSIKDHCKNDAHIRHLSGRQKGKHKRQASGQIAYC